MFHLLQISFRFHPILYGLRGDVVKGEVLAFDDKKQVIVGIEGTGVEGVVPARELSVKADEIEDNIKVGDVLDLVVISKIGSDKEGGSYLLSQRRQP